MCGSMLAYAGTACDCCLGARRSSPIMTCIIVQFLQQVDQAMLIAGYLSAKDVSNLRATCRDLRVTALQMTPELRLPLVPMDLARRQQASSQQILRTCYARAHAVRANALSAPMQTCM